MDDENPRFRQLCSIASGVLGVCLIGVSFFIPHGDDAHRLLNDALQLIMIISGSLAIVAGVIVFFIRTTPDIWS